MGSRSFPRFAMFLSFILCSLKGMGANESMIVDIFQSQDAPDCVEELLSAVVQRRFSGTLAEVHLRRPRTLLSSEEVQDVLVRARVPAVYLSPISRILGSVLSQDVDTDSLLRDPFSAVQEQEGSQLILCVLGGDCKGKHDGIYVTHQADFEVASLRYPEFAEQENHAHRLYVSPRQVYNPLLIASVHSLVESDDSVEIETNALKWVGMLFHELRHHSNRRLVAEWIEANRWLKLNGLPVDSLFQDYVDTSGPIPRIDRGFVTVFEESTAHNAAFRVIARSVKLLDERTAARAGLQNGHVRKKLAEIQAGDYGASAKQTLEDGLHLPDHFGKITDQNFLLIGSIIHNQMISTRERYRDAIGRRPLILPLPGSQTYPSYSIANTATQAGPP